MKVKFKVLQEDYFTPNSLLSIIELENDLKEFQNQLSSNALELDRLEKAADSLNDFEKSANLMKLFKFIISSSGSSDYMVRVGSLVSVSLRLATTQEPLINSQNSL
jgi:hypothetical protein